MNETVIIVAGGKGSRMENSLPKQFLKINHKPIILRTISQFLRYNNKIELIIGLPEEHFDYWKSMCKEYNFDYPHSVAKGGSNRFQTVKNCLSKVKNKDIVAIHDSVRPCISVKKIASIFDYAKKHGAVVPVIPVIDSLRMITIKGNAPADRSKFRAVQTPQIFKWDILSPAYKQAYNENFTDDATVVEKCGHSISLVDGDFRNIKITTPTDLVMAENYLKDINQQD